MARRSYRPEQIIKKLREAEVLLSQGSAADQASRKIEVIDQTSYRWQGEYGGIRTGQIKKVTKLELPGFIF